MGKKPGDKCRKNSFELYDHSRFIALTGNIFENRNKIKENQTAIDWFYNEYLYDNKVELQQVTPTTHSNITLEDVLRVSKNDALFVKLFNGHWEDEKYPSQSEADLALCSKLAFYTGNDVNKIDEFFRQSRLYRKKWERSDYRWDRTIKKAITGQTEFFDWERKGEMENVENVVDKTDENDDG